VNLRFTPLAIAFLYRPSGRWAWAQAHDRACRDEARWTAEEEEERTCTTPILKLPIASGGAALIKRSHSSYCSSMVLNFPHFSPLAVHTHGP